MIDIYDLFKINPLRFSIPEVDKKLKFIEYKYTSKEVTGASVGLFIIFSLLTAISAPLSMFLAYLFMFVGVIMVLASYLYPTSIVYSQRLIEYSEEMLKSIMKISTYISMNQSMEYALIKTTEDLSGTLRTQFEDITHRLQRREQDTLGQVFEIYTPMWNSYNPDFVKSLRLLETATMSPETERKEIIEETIESLMISYYTAGKRSAEQLASNAKTLIAMGVLFPVISLMLLPLVSVFLPDVVNPTLLAFMYNVFFTGIILLMALNFSSRRIQVDTINLKDSPRHKSVNVIIIAMAIAIVFAFAVPAIIHLMTVNTATIETVEREYQLLSVIKVWLLPLGIILGGLLVANYYHTKNKKLWEEVDATENDLPHLLQSVSTYLSLNMSMEKILPAIVDDYKTHGFGQHPTAKFLRILTHKLHVTKKSLGDLTEKILPGICPSKKVTSVLSQIITFTDISQESAAQASKMIRKQTINIYQLDDYMKTMLSETVALIGVTINFLAPILTAAAVLMSLAIVKALTFITTTLEGIQQSFGGDASALQLVNITEIIPPTFVELIVSLYLIEMIFVLSLFQNNIKHGNDTFKLTEQLKSSLMGFILFSLILIAGHYIIIGVLFPQFS